MTITDFIADFLEIKDPNIEFHKELQTIKENGITTKILSGTLSYLLEACPKCGVRNQSTQDMIKYGFAESTIKLPSMNFKALVLKLKKQKYQCKHCGEYSLVTTPLVDPGCSISNDLKRMVAVELGEVQSMTLIARRYSISDYTVAKVLKKAGKALGPSYRTLPEHIGIDEF